MIQREVQDKENITWVCVQSFSMGSEAIADKAEEVMEGVEIVCTPSGGAQTVRFNTSKGWSDNLKDEDLLKLIQNHR